MQWSCAVCIRSANPSEAKKFSELNAEGAGLFVQAGTVDRITAVGVAVLCGVTQLLADFYAAVPVQHHEKMDAHVLRLRGPDKQTRTSSREMSSSNFSTDVFAGRVVRCRFQCGHRRLREPGLRQSVRGVRRACPGG